MVRRYGIIIDTLIKYHFGYLVDQMGLRSVGSLKSRFKGRFDRGGAVNTRPTRARQVLEELGPTYVKFGQFLSMRQDLIPQEYSDEFTKLQDDVPPFAYEDVERVVAEELGYEIGDLFSEFEKEPIAAASIGQVHRAKLPDGADVAVKVQRPEIRDVIDVDLDIMYSIAGFAQEHIHDAQLYQPVDIVDELSRSIHAELDYTQEARNIERFLHNFRNDPNIKIPKVYWGYSSKRVLTMEYIDGVKCINFDKLDELGVDPNQVATYGTEAFMKQVFEDAFFHADLHAGNVFVLRDGRVALLDFGMVGYLSKEVRSFLTDALIAITRGNMVQFIEVLRDFGVVSERLDERAFKVDCDYLLNRYYGRSLDQLDVSVMSAEIMGILRMYQIRIPSNVALLIRGMMTASGFATQIAPDFNVTTIAEPYAKKVIRKRIRPDALARSAYNDMWYVSRLLHKAPLQLSHILSVAEKGYLNIRFENQGMDRIVSEMSASSNRLAFSLIISAIIVGSSLVIQTGMEPHLWGVPMLGVLGFITAGVLGMGLAVYILRTGRI
ncbi:MAG: AarF/ABC1/UbiB kinase family protein [Euryarchaeota archaeon]|nr:AarF/ABC1/UbiB kinase family protein [Euryarchaeota archaeon]